jgi:hypothetical protein
MNIFQSLNLAFSGGTLLALLAGLAKIPAPIRQRPLTLWLFVAFFFLLRLKMCLDDHKYYASPETKNVHFKIGFMVGVLSWVLWVLAAWSVSVLLDAYFLVGVAVTISTLWIITVAVRQGAYKEQYFWMGTNALFVLLLWIVYRRNISDPDWMTWASLGAAIVLVIVDFVVSKSIPELEK